MMREILIAMYYKNNGDWLSIYSDLKNKIKISDEEIKKVDKWINNECIATIVDENYPDFLKRISNPPFVVNLKLMAVEGIKNKDLRKVLTMNQLVDIKVVYE